MLREVQIVKKNIEWIQFRATILMDHWAVVLCHESTNEHEFSLKIKYFIII